MDTITLNNGKTIPVLGYGTWNLAPDAAANATEEAIKSGYRHIDCAMIYGNEKEVGEGIKRAIDAGIVTRGELFITSKLWNTDHAPDDVAVACRKTLQDLGIEYLDLYLVHWAVAFEHGDDTEPLDNNGVAKFAPVSLQQTWHAMEKLVDEGLVRSIGVANYTAPMLLDLLTYANTKPVMNQIELHPYHTQDHLVRFCQSQGIAVTAYSPFGSIGAAILDDPVVQKLAKEYGRTPAQVALRWAVQRGTIVIPKSANKTRIAENIAISDFELSAADMDALNALDQRKIFVNPNKWWGFPYF